MTTNSLTASPFRPGWRLRAIHYSLLSVLISVGFINNTQALELELPVSNSVITLSVPEDATVLEQRKLKQWILAAADAVANTYGEFPLDRARVKISYYRRANEPVPWATVIRDGIQGVHFYVNPEFSLQRFLDDWTAFHEFSHLLIPYPGRAGMWFSEGLASYYQNILQARAGVITPETAFQKLLDGFKRGTLDKTTGGLTLRKLSLEMKQRRSFMRVYWAGAAYFLNVDVALRQAGLPIKSLDEVLKEFKDCCLLRERKWTTKQIIDEFDRISDSELFSIEYQKIIDQTTFPKYLHSFSALGINLNNNKVVEIKANQANALLSNLINGN